MQYEVENKYAIEDPALVVEQLADFKVRWSEPAHQADWYFAHPVRDFAVTDEALRIRSIGAENFITYKGPKIDTATKTRREIELPLASGVDRPAAYGALLESLGFRPVATVRKRRRIGRCIWNETPIEIAVDEVPDVGNFIELEILADQQTLARAQATLVELARRLGLEQPVRRSYLEMLMSKL